MIKFSYLLPGPFQLLQFLILSSTIWTIGYRWPMNEKTVLGYLPVKKKRNRFICLIGSGSSVRDEKLIWSIETNFGYQSKFLVVIIRCFVLFSGRIHFFSIFHFSGGWWWIYLDLSLNYYYLVALNFICGFFVVFACDCGNTTLAHQQLSSSSLSCWFRLVLWFTLGYILNEPPPPAKKKSWTE